MPIEVVATPEAKEKATVKADTMFSLLVSKTPAKVDTYFDNQLSALSGYTDAEIDTYIDTNIIDLNSAKATIKILAKDSSFNSSITRTMAKALVLLARKI